MTRAFANSASPSSPKIRMLKKSTSVGKVTLEISTKKNVRSSLNLDLDLNLIHLLRTIELPSWHNNVSVSS